MLQLLDELVFISLRDIACHLMCHVFIAFIEENIDQATFISETLHQISILRETRPTHQF